MPDHARFEPGRRGAAAPANEDERLIAEAGAPPDPQDARESLEFWERRLASSRLLERSKRREAKRMVEQWRSRVRDAERARYGPRPLEALLEALGARRLPGRKLVTAAKWLGLVIGGLAIALIAALIAFWPDLEPILRDLIQLGGGAGGD